MMRGQETHVPQAMLPGVRWLAPPTGGCARTHALPSASCARRQRGRIVWSTSITQGSGFPGPYKGNPRLMLSRAHSPAGRFDTQVQQEGA